MPDAHMEDAALEAGGEKRIELRKTANLRSYDTIPELEWWDAQFLPPTAPGSEEGLRRFPDTEIGDQDIYLEKITHYI